MFFGRNANQEGSEKAGNAKAGARTGAAKPFTPLDAKQQALLEKEAQLRSKTEELERLIEEAPKRRDEIERKRREEVLVGNQTLFAGAALRDRRYDVAVADTPPVSARRLRSERRDGRFLFLVLLFVLLGLGLWIANLLNASLR